MAQPAMLADLKTLLKRDIDDCKPLGGGCSYPAYVVESGKSQFFVKTNRQGGDVFLTEAEGLLHLQRHSSLVPEIVFSDAHYLVLEYIPPALPEKTFWQNLAHELGLMHQQRGERFGFHQNNYIGLSRQQNHWDTKMSWAQFFWQDRLSFKIEQLKEQGFEPLSDQDVHRLKKVCLNLLEDHPKQPSPLHGDLWSGNIICGKGQRPFLVDPAFYYGDPEADMAMTECFGGFHDEFYQAYSSEFTVSHGYLIRKHLYNLYHMLNHQVIFGSSYQTTVRKIVDQLLAQ